MTKKKAFFLTIILTLASIAPLFMLIILPKIAEGPPTQVSKTQQDVPIILPTASDYKTILVVTQNPEPVFLLLRIDAVRTEINGAFFPKETIILQNGTPTTIEKTWQTKGAIHVVRGLEETFEIGIDNYYQTDIKSIVKNTTSLGSIPVNLEDFGDSKDTKTIEKYIETGMQNNITVQTSQDMLAEFTGTGSEKAQLRSIIYTSFLQKESDFSQALLDILNDKDAVTDITAQDRFKYERIIKLIQDSEDKKININAIPLHTKNDVYELNDDSWLYVQEYFM